MQLPATHPRNTSVKQPLENLFFWSSAETEELVSCTTTFSLPRSDSTQNKYVYWLPGSESAQEAAAQWLVQHAPLQLLKSHQFNLALHRHTRNNYEDFTYTVLCYTCSVKKTPVKPLQPSNLWRLFLERFIFNIVPNCIKEGHTTNSANF